jgi:elongation factor P
LIDTSDFKNGMSIQLDGDLFTIVEFQHVKPGKGGAFVRTKLRNVRTGGVVDKTFRAGEKFEQAILERKPIQFLYSMDDDYTFMDMESYDQATLSAAQLGQDTIKYLKDGLEVSALIHKETILGVELPLFLDLEVVETDPGERGNTASGGSKPAKLETGAVVQVPFFVNIGDRVKVDTRTDTYLERSKN